MAYIIEVINNQEFKIFTFKEGLSQAMKWAREQTNWYKKNYFIFPTHEEFMETITNTFPK